MRQPMGRPGWTAWVLALLSAAPGAALACTCLWAGPFTTVALRADVIVVAEVLRYERHGMDVRVLEVLKGSERRETIRLWGDTGALCRPYASGFPIGTRWIFAVSPVTEPRPGASWVDRLVERVTAGREYAINGCGDYWLQVRGDRAIGGITVAGPVGGLQGAALAEVTAWVRAGGAGPLPKAERVTR